MADANARRSRSRRRRAKMTAPLPPSACHSHQRGQRPPIASFASDDDHHHTTSFITHPSDLSARVRDPFRAETANRLNAESVARSARLPLILSWLGNKQSDVPPARMGRRRARNIALLVAALVGAAGAGGCVCVRAFFFREQLASSRFCLYRTRECR